MAYTQDQIDKAKEQYAKGALELELNGERVKFVSGKEFRRRIQDMEDQVAGGSSGMSVSYASSSRGL
ncbi:phage head-tail joining protein [Pelagimonas varians]|uniref:Uncharacterized protein n=1 Tax=Pelagimonas varians TaxID=696760 RepID=A0A238KF03_9RHOB|nr:hypothetical protein [Pelagimonas varians]PYG29975.1 hypothetical protein C8N36_107141 [Pelagimonas varians]SMX40596.1 hypothetical protein PEV8663_02054 [Pelagimonas varians]